jgi:hypothetical protein
MNYKTFPIALILILFYSCSKQILDEIDTNPNNPLDVPVRELIPSVTSGVAYFVNGTDLAWYSSVFVEYTTGTFSDMRKVDRRTAIGTDLSENAWKSLYAKLMMDLDVIIEKGSTGGEEEGNWKYVGIAKVLMAYTMSTTTDLWGRVPYSEAFQGAENRQPIYDSQESIYTGLQTLLDEAIVNLSTSSIENPGNEDLIYAGDTVQWIKAAYVLKAKLYNRLSKTANTVTYTNLAIDAIKNGFTGTKDDMVFSNWSGSADESHQNPWYLEKAQNKQLSISKTITDMLDSLNDPRKSYYTGIARSSSVYNPAPNGTASEDANGILYSKISDSILYEDAPIPLLTYHEMKFIEAECYIRQYNVNLANFAFEKAVLAALANTGITSGSDITKYTTQEEVFPGQDKLTINHIITQKYLALFPFGAIEAYSDWRRTGVPQLNNAFGDPPRRFPYPQSEINTNAANVPNIVNLYTDGVWWDDGTED